MSADAVKKVSETKSKTSEDKPSSKPNASSESSSSEKTKPNKNAGPARPISYFSSVSTDEYRSGWNAIFSNTKEGPKVSNKKRLKRKKPLNPVRYITLSNSDLDDELANLLLVAARKRAKKDKITIGKRLNKSNLEWRLECKIEK